MENLRSKIKGIQVRSLLNGQLDEIKQNLASRVGAIGFEKSGARDAKNFSSEDECLAVVENYLSDNSELISEFLSRNSIGHRSLDASNPATCGVARSGPGESVGEREGEAGGEASCIEAVLEEATLRRRQADLKLYSQLSEMFQPFLSTLGRFERIHATTAEIVSFLGGHSGSEGYCGELSSCSDGLQSLTRLLLKLHKRRRLRLVIDRLQKLDKLKNVQSEVQLLLNGKSYERAIRTIEDSVELLRAEMEGIRAVSTLPVQLYEMQNVIEKLVCQDFIHFIVSWLGLGEVGSDGELPCPAPAESGPLFEPLFALLRLADSAEANSDLKDSLFREIRRASLLLDKGAAAELATMFNASSVMDPIFVLIKRERINFAIDELEVHINSFVDDANQSLIARLDKGEICFEAGGRNALVCSKVKVCYQSLEVLLNYNVFNIIYKLIVVFSVVVQASVCLRGSREAESPEAINKNLKHIYIPVVQLLEQTLMRIFSRLGISGEDKGQDQLDLSPSNFEHWTMYYVTYLKYIMVITKLQNGFSEQISKACSGSPNLPNDKTTNFFGKTAVDLRVSLYNYYKNIFETGLLRRHWTRLCAQVDHEKWDKRDLSVEYGQTFQLFTTGRLGEEESVKIQGHFVTFNNQELILPECCLRCIESLGDMLLFVQKAAIISYLGLSRALSFIIDYCNKCFESIMDGGSVRKGRAERITAFSMILCAQNIYFWMISVESLVNYQLRVLEKGSIADDGFVKEHLELLSEENDLGVLLGVRLPEGYVNNLRLELERTKTQLERAVERSSERISGVIVDRFRGFIGNWMLNNTTDRNSNLTRSDLEKHSVDFYLNSFARDLSNMDKTLRKYLRIDPLARGIVDRINKECLDIWKNFLWTEFKTFLAGTKKLNYLNVIFDLYYFHMEIMTSSDISGEESRSERRITLPATLLETVFEHFQSSSSRFSPEEASQIYATYYFVKSKLDT
ncbi:hypothetical protein OJ252_2134 [Cryptosporidium canis]|uniref:Uncharacterized protein n=1 Tax=Cryptosporidium canis TaxID=195482 RepID=A0ABQ8P6J1_9CRYT|nr:hypothetical protein OJ252_2134 [Cryptosporidium canis]